ncbi:unnamed protein product, partial [Meganyctiphanes norvegica]
MKATSQWIGVLSILLLSLRIEAACHTCVYCEELDSDTRVTETEPDCLKTFTTVGKYIYITRLTTISYFNVNLSFPISRVFSPFEIVESCNEKVGQDEVCSGNSDYCNVASATGQLTNLGNTVAIYSYYTSVSWILNNMF